MESIMSESTDLNKIIPSDEPMVIGGKTITPRTMKVKQLPAVLKAVQPFAGVFKDGVQSLDIPTLLIDHTPNVVELVHQLTGEDKEWVENLELDEMIEVFTKVVEVNLDFFIRKVLPLLSEAMVRLGGGLSSKTQISGQASSST
jgi:hypothetical protein